MRPDACVPVAPVMKMFRRIVAVGFDVVVVWNHPERNIVTNCKEVEGNEEESLQSLGFRKVAVGESRDNRTIN